MEEKYHKSYLQVVLSGLKIHINLQIGMKDPKKLHDLHNDLQFFLVRMKTEKVEKPVANFHDKKICYTHKKFKTSTKLCISIEKGT